MRRTRVYIAGPYTKPDPHTNTVAAQAVWDTLWKFGYCPFCPHWSHYQQQIYPLHYEDWIDFDFQWIDCCDVLLRLPGESSGADREVELATNLGMTVLGSVVELLKRVPKTWIDGHIRGHMSLREQLDYRERLAGGP